VTAQEIAAALSDIDTLQKRCRAVAILDAILSPEWNDRYYSYTAAWGDGAGSAEIRDGSGSDCFIVFTPDGAFIKGLDRESPMARGEGARRSPGPAWSPTSSRTSSPNPRSPADTDAAVVPAIVSVVVRSLGQRAVGDQTR
jgi:hypothetical protein